MKVNRKLERSAPVYLRTRDDVVSLVYEVATIRAELGPREGQPDLRITEPVAVHLIDDTGVQRLRIGQGARPLLGIATAFLLGPLQWALIGRRRRNRG